MDEQRAEYLVERYTDMLLRIGYTWFNSRDDAQDICQIVLIKALEDGRDFPDAGQERAFLIRMAINECKNWTKSAWFRKTVGLDQGVEFAVWDPEPEEDGVLAQVQALPTKYRRVVYLRYYEGYEVAEIAGLLGESPALVSTHLARAKAKLKMMLGGTIDGRVEQKL